MSAEILQMIDTWIGGHFTLHGFAYECEAYFEAFVETFVVANDDSIIVEFTIFLKHENDNIAFLCFRPI